MKNSIVCGTIQVNLLLVSTCIFLLKELVLLADEDVKKLTVLVKKNYNLRLIQNDFQTLVSESNWDAINEEYIPLFKENTSEIKTVNR